MNSVPGHNPSRPGTAATGGELAGRTALVTGAGSGIGRACAAALAEAGARVHLVDRDEAVTAVADEIGGTAHVVDLADDDPTRTLPTAVDVLVNNAGLQHVAPVHEFPPEKFALLQRVMVTAPFLLARHVLPHMRRQRWGRLVHVSSVHGRRASAFKSAYVTAKHGLEGLSKVLALEGAEHGVTSNCVSPGYVRTPLVEDQLTSQAEAHGIDPHRVLADVLLTRHAVKELVEPHEVADLVRWLCGATARHVTGSSFTIDGGWTAR
ncbi:3-hydroxybutyrate dehydrogenase [Actinosynnema sp. NPDC047251]|uniref:3-oxoacyl-[acyl-carrier-protein] reductase n=1 Tax=Saccharothrix espanaensis (strain ATCC 51144 / DSM 44229 / JCM 9112 / NBRC 15066 / NRRL 15764) TaxID=1179773 RepID=K0JYE9_SACES|nr:3-hydroxybutyrate dehydrogenase [Saccharothrix espanaensis]CCH29238.1 3-oxoacyl-[acyl-carrier-protein] reductase [Saccharothrix espanaensis DSM 44229]